MKHFGDENMLTVYPHDNPIAFCRYMAKCLRNLPQWDKHMEADLVAAMDHNNIYDVIYRMVDKINHLLEALTEDTHQIDFSWGDPNSNEKLGTTANPCWLNVYTACAAADHQEAALLSVCFLPELKKRDRSLHDILVRMFSHLINEIDTGGYMNYVEDVVRYMEEREDEELHYSVEHHIAELKTRKSAEAGNGTLLEILTEDKQEEQENDLIDQAYELAFEENEELQSLHDGLSRWRDDPKFPGLVYAELLRKRYSVRGTKAMVKRYNWKRKNRSQIKAWIDKVFTALDRGVKITNYCHYNAYNESGVPAHEYYSLIWGAVDDRMDTEFHERIQNQWENAGFNPMKRAFDLGHEPLRIKHNKNQRRIEPVWNDDPGPTLLADIFNTGTHLFDQYSAKFNFDIAKIQKHYRNEHRKRKD